MSALPVLQLVRNAERRLREGHLWVYSNELAGKVSQIGLAPGALVRLTSASGQPLGVGYFNPATLIAVRLLDAGEATINAAFWQARLKSALRLRQALGRARFGRQVHSEADGLPGLILDRFDQVMVGQLGTAGLQQRRTELESAIREVYAPAALVWKNDGIGRALEGLDEGTEAAFGQVGELRVEEGPASFRIPFGHAQKTGWFYDQRDNRDRVFGLLGTALTGGDMLDICSYQGGWALRALWAGARTAVCLDASEQALVGCRSNASSNGFEGRLETWHGSAMDVLREIQPERRFGLVVADPPAFIKRRKDAEAGSIAYARLFAAAMKRVETGGWLVACSCSHHYPATELLAALAAAAWKQRRRLRILAELAQGADHPVHPAMPETRYLKGLLCALD